MPFPLAGLVVPLLKVAGPYIARAGAEWAWEKGKSLIREAAVSKRDSAPATVNARAIEELGLGSGLGLAASSKWRAQQLISADVIQKWTKQLLESQQQITQYNGAMRSAQMVLDANRIGRDIRTGAATQKTFAELARATDRLERAKMPFEIDKQNKDNEIAAAANRAEARSLELEVENNKVLKDIRDNLKKEAADPFLNQIALRLASNAKPPRAAPPQPGKDGRPF